MVDKPESIQRIQKAQVPADAIDPNATLDEHNYDEFVQDVLVAHNYYRSLHGVPALELKPEISKYSLNWARTMAIDNQIKYSSKSDRPNYGENTYYFGGKYVHGSQVVDSWYNESLDHNYQYGKEPRDFRAGHFTQLIWKNSIQLGVGAVVGEKGLFVVCNYEPAGNIPGHYVLNVLPPLP